MKLRINFSHFAWMIMNKLRPIHIFTHHSFWTKINRHFFRIRQYSTENSARLQSLQYSKVVNRQPLAINHFEWKISSIYVLLYFVFCQQVWVRSCHRSRTHFDLGLFKIQIQSAHFPVTYRCLPSSWSWAHTRGWPGRGSHICANHPQEDGDLEG